MKQWATLQLFLALALLGPAYSQAMVVQVDPGLLSMLLLQELVGLHTALPSLLRLWPGEPHLGTGGMMASGLATAWAAVPTPHRRPEDPTTGVLPTATLPSSSQVL